MFVRYFENKTRNPCKNEFLDVSLRFNSYYMADEVNASPTREIEKELGFLPWLSKIVERCTLALLCMKEKQDKISESDYEVLRALHGVWFFGEVPFYQTIQIPTTSKSTQPSLFDAQISHNGTETPLTTDISVNEVDKKPDGKKIADTPKKPKKKKKK
jgi:hypothetical protein